MANLNDVFSKKISTWKPEAQRWMTACNLFGYGASDDATIMHVQGTMRSNRRRNKCTANSEGDAEQADVGKYGSANSCRLHDQRLLRDLVGQPDTACLAG